MSAPSAQRSSRRRARGDSDPSGRLLLRMPPALHGELAQAAVREGSSLNQFIADTLAGAIDWSGDGVRPRPGVAPGTADEPIVGARIVDPVIGRDSRRLLLGVLVVNAVVVGLAALAAIGLLAYAWLG